MAEPQPNTNPDEGSGTEIPQTKTIVAFLAEHRQGGLANEASEQLAEVTEAARRLGKKGSLTITITVDPIKDNSAGLVNVSDEIKAKIPKEPTPGSTFFTDERGNLSRRDPRQPEITGLRDASK